MKSVQRAMVAAATTVLVFGGWSAGAGVAHAVPYCSPATFQEPQCAPPEGPPFGCDANNVCAQLWCPGSGMINVPDWDMTRCHTFYFDPNAPLTEPVMIPGVPPGPPRPPQPPCIPFINCLPGL